jgi:hypothetical protein
MPYNYHITKKGSERSVINIGGFAYVQEALCRFKRYITMTDYSDVHVTFRMNDITRKSSSDHRKMISVVYMMVYMMR